MRGLAIIALFLSATTTAQPQPQGRITSAYTKLDLDACSREDKGEEPQSQSWRCSGLGGIPLYVQNGDDRYDVDAGLEDNDAFWNDHFDYPGATVEWRLLGGTPFAIIYRLTASNLEQSRSSVLIVETVGRSAKPGCRVARIPGSAADANQRARDVADRLLRQPPFCLRPE